jgi:hypothetical protein
MKTMTCRQLGGGCDQKFSAKSFDDIADLSRKHTMEMFQNGDKAHVDAITEMQKIMKSGGLNQWMDRKRREFDSLPDDN